MIQKKFYIPPEEKVHEIGGADALAEPKKILILEDEEQFADLLRQFLEASGYQVAVVGNGVQGLKRIMETDFDVVLCDMLMPHLPGAMFYLAVEKARPMQCRRFVFMTGHKGEPSIDEFIRKVRGMVLWKPFQMHEMLEAVEAVIKKHASDSH
jgi:DNA-binding NtrC family response regulator